MKLGIKITLQNQVLDVQGRAVQKAFERDGLKFDDCRIGKWVVIDTGSLDKESSMNLIKKVLDQGLYNPLIETYCIEELDNK